MKLRKFLFLVLAGLFLITFVIADQEICIDFDSPSPPTNLVLTSSENNIQLNWNGATDIPDCSGIDYYDIYRGFNNGNLILIGNSSDTSFLDVGLDDGTYEYIIHAWDLAGHNEGTGVYGIISLGNEKNNDNGDGGSSGGGGFDNDNGPYWNCEDWSECIGGIRTRICTNIDNPSEQRQESSTDCSLKFEGLSEENILFDEPTTGMSKITGAVIGFAKSGKMAISLIFVILVLIALGLLTLNKRKTNNPPS